MNPQTNLRICCHRVLDLWKIYWALSAAIDLGCLRRILQLPCFWKVKHPPWSCCSVRVLPRTQTADLAVLAGVNKGSSSQWWWCTKGHTPQRAAWDQWAILSKTPTERKGGEKDRGTGTVLQQLVPELSATWFLFPCLWKSLLERWSKWWWWKMLQLLRFI